MRPSVPLELPRAKGNLTEADAISRAKAPSGRSLGLTAWICVSVRTGAAATSTAAESEMFFRLLAGRSNTLLSQPVNG